MIQFFMKLLIFYKFQNENRMSENKTAMSAFKYFEFIDMECTRLGWDSRKE